MFPRAALVILGLLLSIIVFLALRGLTGPMKMEHDQISAGSAYMKSLKEDDVQRWIERTQKLLPESDPGSQSIGVYGMEGKPIPPDLEQLKITRIDISSNQVRYVWMGGMGPRVDLEVDRLPDGSFTLTAHYSDTDSEVIWPRTSNQSMKPTAPRRYEFLLTGVSNARSAAECACQSRGLSLSR